MTAYQIEQWKQAQIAAQGPRRWWEWASYLVLALLGAAGAALVMQ